MKIVDTLDEQARLEELLEASKPPVPAECSSLHYLLSTPFRYGSPYPLGSRFRRAGHTPGVVYASKAPATAVVEAAFHRLLFFVESPDTPWPANAGEYTAFSVRYRTSAGLDLTVPPLDRDRTAWTHPTKYAACQDLADAARTTGFEVLRYESVRDAGPPAGVNIALLTCRAFVSRQPVERQTWRIHLGPGAVRAICTFPEMRLELPHQSFARDPRIARYSLRDERP